MNSELTSLQNPRVKGVCKLRKRRDRDGSGLFLVEGYRETQRALQTKWPVKSLYYCESLFLGTNEGEVLDRARDAGAELWSCSESVFRKMAYRDRPDGLIAVAEQKRRGLDDLDPGPNPLLLVLAGIEKPGNLGTMLRSADGAGVDAVLLCDAVTDLFNPNVVRASVGTLFSVPVAECGLAEASEWLRGRGIPLLALTPRGSRTLYETDVSGPVAVAMGSEMLGLDDRWLERADLQVSLPMHGVADSLNVSSAAAITLYEVVRQRGE